MRPAVDDVHLPEPDKDGNPEHLVQVIERLFRGQAFAIADHQVVGNPIIFASNELETLSGFPTAEFQGRNVGFLLRDDTEQQGDVNVRDALSEGRSATQVLRIYRRDGTLLWSEQRHFPLIADDGTLTHVVTVFDDVDLQVHAAAAQELGRELNASLDGDGRYFNYSILLYDSGEAEVAWVSDGWSLLSGYDAADLQGSGLGRFVHPDDRERLTARLRGLRHQDRRSDQYRLVTQGGNIVWLEDFAAKRWRNHEAGVTAIYGVAQDITASKRESGEMWRLAHVDSLTGLPNDQMLEDRVLLAQHAAKRNGKHMALVLLDLDHFRFVNQTFSRRHGDRLILELSRRLRRALRRTDTLARWGGDSFALLLGDLPAQHAVLPALEKILRAVEEPFEDGSLSLQLAASLGVDLYPEGARSAMAMIERAAEALRRAKENTRGSFSFYDKRLEQRMRERTALETEVKEALSRDQLILHYQPRIELDSGAISSVEALVRWLHPTKGLLKPAEFLPLIYDSRLGFKLFEWVLERSCSQARRWQHQRTPRRVAVNVGQQALERPELLDTIKETLSRHDLHPGLLEIEVSERLAVDTLMGSADALAAIRSMGVHVALDDFGVAKSSLSQLRELPLDGLKIDRSFVSPLGETPSETHQAGEDVDLLRAIISLGKSLRLRVTAEGIETREQNSLLRSLRCDEGQGFLYSQPVPAEYVPAFA